MRYFHVFIALLCCAQLFAQVRVCSWNLCDMGASKAEKSIDFMASVLKDFDVVAVQEIVANATATRSMAQLVDALNRSGINGIIASARPRQAASRNANDMPFCGKRR